jgi:Tat protein secretion system quality control protein TatD with DNase activity
MNLAVARKLIKAVDENKIPESFLKGKEFTSDSHVDELVSDYKSILGQMGVNPEEKPVQKKQPDVSDKDIEEWAKGPGPRYSI